MVENNLRISSVTRTVHQESEGQRVNQVIQVQVGDKQIAEGQTLLEQLGQNTASVLTESLGTPTTDYVRYADIKTNQKNEQGKDLDFSKVLNVWGKSAGSEQTTGELYGESVLGVIPVANLSAPARARVMAVVRDHQVYKIDYSTVKGTKENGRRIYTYHVKVIPEGYIALLKAYGQEVGLQKLTELDPAQYKNASPLEFDISVDVLSHRMTKITYPNGREENFGSYGVHRAVTLPKQTIPIEQLQERIQNVQ
jgi:hypothetical protein